MSLTPEEEEGSELRTSVGYHRACKKCRSLEFGENKALEYAAALGHEDFSVFVFVMKGFPIRGVILIFKEKCNFSI